MARTKGVALVILGALALVATILAQVVPGVQDFLIAKGLFAAATLLLLIDVAHGLHRNERAESLRVATNQDESMPRAIAAVPLAKREKLEFIEYAGSTTLPLLRAAQREVAIVRLLIKHPDTVEGLQQQRMIATLDTLYNSVFRDQPAVFEARCYRQPYSVRGRRMGTRFLEIGWLTPDYQNKTAHGHDNPSILIEELNTQNRCFYEFFERTFDSLWEAPDTEDARAVLARLLDT